MAGWSVDPNIVAMAGWVVGPKMEKIINACSDYLHNQYRRQTGMRQELIRLRENHPEIQAVVSASTQAQIRDRNPELNSWFWQLRDAIDEADDVLDDIEYMNLEEQDIRNKKLQKVVKVVKKIVKSAHKMDPNLKRLEKVVKKLDKVSAEVSTFLYLLENAKQEQEQHGLELQLFKDRETRCLPKSDLIGRVEEKDFVMKWLRNEDPARPSFDGNISLLSIVGVGGVGKTTLLQHIYKDLKEEFELKMWVCVSNDFDPKMVIADMLECLMEERPRLEGLAALQGSLKAVVHSKRFLLVLDDIWEENVRKWENVLSPLIHGSIGSKILLTTRMDSVAAMISKVIGKKKETLKLNGLEEDVCLKLLNTRAFAGEENIDSQTKLADIASLIVKKLSGSPLVAKVIGDVLNSNLKESFWKNILNSNVLNAESELGRNNILSHLRLSFTFLPQPLQNCFAFCGIFPQDYEFDKDDLVRMWIALGFIQKSFFEEETLEDIGGRYFDDLVKKSFFDKFQYSNRIHYKTHALLHDLALSISSEECFRFVEDNIQSLRIPKTIRHLFVKTENLEVLRMIKGVKNLHSLLLISRGGGQGFTKILTEIFNASQSIRLLFINSPDLETLSEAFKNLRHLRYLNLNVNLTQMPRSISRLYHLQFIIYKKVVQGSCSNDFLPDEVSNLSKLRHLELPSSVFEIGKLKSVRELNEFNVNNENGYRIEELKHMSELRKLRIHFLENVNDASEARTANLSEKKNLTDLFLNWGNTVDEGNLDEEFGCLRRIVNSDLDENVLENLKPNKNLKSLSIFSYKGAKSAEWMCNAGRISNLEHISLNGCSEWETLPPFGELRYLKSLCLCNMPKAKRLYYQSRGNVFPLLEVLNIKGLQVLEDWFDGAAAYDRFFPCLTELSLDNCPNLQELPYLPPKLKKMRICMIGWKSLNCKQGTSKSIPLETLEVRLCPNITSLFLADVAKLTIEGCPNLTSLGGVQQVESGTEKFQLIVSEVVIDNPSLLPAVSIASLEKLTICNNDELVSFTIEAEQWFGQVSSSLRELIFRRLRSLQSLPSSLECLSSLKILRVVEVPQLQELRHSPASLEELHLESLESLPSYLERLSSLKILRVVNVNQLQELGHIPTCLDELHLECLNYPPTSLSTISSLNRLHLNSIPLNSLPELPPSLSGLYLYNLANLECLPSLSAISSLKQLVLDSIPLLKSLPDLPSYLYLITVKNCHPDLVESMKSYKKFSSSDWYTLS